MQLEVVRGDITTLRVDAIVNAANNAMRGGGGVDGAIHRAAGPRLLTECVERFPDGLATGAAGWTTGHRLPARWVVHVVGPVYDGTGRNRPALVSCYTSALAVADALAREHEVGDFTMAFPLVSAGVYGWPLEDAVDAQVTTLATTRTQVTRCLLVGFGTAAHRALTRAVDALS
ncbi:MAG: O-acetyl-ADP-ribose deacetylase [uncultured Nocardioidaceae bacterium]|uniref:O-acetyl-ADP-ribose deacetylase n=1 Tax=uncultured Nocardioidaceae bacterium TaxID=253824 RepID=A0A6J4LS67_9ACTN|nr:MAG: O-acetyl-ADP-ribose deacetylase [uncultured Nocardioidaceae bacterium]